MKIVVGLGNPGESYVNTRHNLGFRVVDRVAARLQLSWQLDDGPCWVAHGQLAERPFALLKPATFMNLSGRVLEALSARGELEREHLLVVLDDLDLPTGQLRLRKSGSAGGHRGLESIIGSLASPEFLRLRIGIGTLRGDRDAADYVLSTEIEEVERARLEASIDSASEAVILWLSWAAAEDLMTRFNRRIDSAS